MHRQEKYDIGVIVGRFQVAELSVAHNELINKVSFNHAQTLVLIGISPTLGTRRNPLGYTARKQMIESNFPDVNITHIMDVGNDKDWSATLDKIIRAIYPIGNVCLYGGRDSFIEHYTGCYDTFALQIIGEEEGTKLREKIGKDISNSVNFRKGIIHSCENQYGKVFPTVDIAVCKKEVTYHEVLMGSRGIGSGWRFPGGFVDPSDKSLELAAKRELAEEIGVETGEMRYVCSQVISDWRYNSIEERIHTTFFITEYIFGTSHPISEFEETKWIRIHPDYLDSIEDAHKPLFEALIAYTQPTKRRRNVK